MPQLLLYKWTIEWLKESEGEMELHERKRNPKLKKQILFQILT